MRVLRYRTVVCAVLLMSAIVLLLHVGTDDDRAAQSPLSQQFKLTNMNKRRLLLERGCADHLNVTSVPGEQHPLKMPSLLTVRGYRADTERQGYLYLAHNPSAVSHILVDEKHGAMYCYVPKVACTNWKRLLMITSGRTNETDPLRIPPDSVHRTGALLKLEDFQTDEILKRLETYKKFIFVRDPLERILSAFRNKFEKNYTSSAYFKKRFGVKIQRMFRKGGEAGYISPIGEGTTFAEFANYLVKVTKEDPESLNEHWAPIVQLCQPCLVRYDLVGKYESLEEDTAVVMRTVFPESKILFPPSKQSVTAKLLPEYLAELTPTQRLQLQQVFADDILLFGYTYRNYKAQRYLKLTTT